MYVQVTVDEAKDIKFFRYRRDTVSLWEVYDDVETLKNAGLATEIYVQNGLAEVIQNLTDRLVACA